MTATEVEALTRDDMRALDDARVVAHVPALLVAPPRPLQLAWPYGAAGVTFDAFLVLDHPRSGTGIVHCQQGFGPAHPWGLIFTDRGPLSTGTDDGWYPRFLDAYFESKASADVPIWRVREWQTSRDGAWLSGELPWDEAWAQVAELRASAPHGQHYCDHSIRY